MQFEECVNIDVNSNCEDIVLKLNELKNRHVIIIAGDMSIEYVGRASSYAPQGLRIFIAKPDGSLLIHESHKVEPLNWQPPKSVVRYECKNGNLFVNSRRLQPVEELLIEFSKLYFIWTCRLATTQLVVIGREADIVKAIVMNADMLERGAMVIGTDIATPYGKVDVLLKKEDGTLIVVEAKNEKASISAVMQLKRYVDFYKEKGFNVIGILVAPSITEEAFAYILKEKNMKFVELKTFFSMPSTKQIHALDKYIK
jgi:RecB family endonuclease NucS|uniref:Endonuclease NucS n=1 Tax=Ignisphaera aggregans TaxID=334771 RepID=A0A7J2U000_9CREN